MRTQRGGIVTGWLVKVILSLLLLGLIAFEAGAVIVNTVGVDGTADTAAREAALTYGTSHDAAAARVQAEHYAGQDGAKVTGFSISRDGQTITVTVEKTAKTLFLQKIGPLKKWRVARATHTAKVG